MKKSSPPVKVPVKFAIPDEYLKDHPVPDQLHHRSVRNNLSHYRLHTVCEEASCPNLAHCWGSGTATYLIMGDRCTRNCKFCDIRTGKPFPLNPMEPFLLARSVREMQLRHVVITSVDRDDLPDGGSSHFGKCIEEVKKQNPGTSVEVLIPDFKGRVENLQHIWNAEPEIIAHNLETVPSLYKSICPQSRYDVSLQVLKLSSEQGFLTKTGLMLGLGETLEEVKRVIYEAKEAGTNILTLGQYLPPTENHAPLSQVYSEEVFSMLKEYALGLGYLHVEAGVLVRSSYHAGVGIQKIIRKFYRRKQES